MKIVLFYNSKTGFTKKYADSIAQELDCDVKPYKDFEKTPINADDIVIFGSRILAGRIEYLDKVKARVKSNLVVFAVGAAPADAESTINKLWADNFTESEINTIPHFYMQGGLDYDKMSFVSRSVMKTIAKLLSKKKDKTEEEADFEQAISASCNNSSKEYVMPLVDFVNQMAIQKKEA